jgi:hypothetical protein
MAGVLVVRRVLFVPGVRLVRLVPRLRVVPLVPAVVVVVHVVTGHAHRSSSVVAASTNTPLGYRSPFTTQPPFDLFPGAQINSGEHVAVRAP